jgi:hypothetical protein
LQKRLGVQGYETPGKAIAWCYGGPGDLPYGLMSQWLKKQSNGFFFTFKFNHGIHFLKCF